MTSKTLTITSTGTVGTYGSLQEVKGNMTVATPAAATYTLNNASTTVTLGSVNATASFTLNAQPGTPPAGYSVGHTVNRSYTLSYANWSTGTVDLKLAYLQGEAGGGVTEGKLKDFQGGTIASTSKVHGTPTRVTSGGSSFGTLTYAGLTSTQLGGSTNAIAMDDQYNQFISIAAANWNSTSTGMQAQCLHHLMMSKLHLPSEFLSRVHCCDSKDSSDR